MVVPVEVSVTLPVVSVAVLALVSRETLVLLFMLISSGLLSFVLMIVVELKAEDGGWIEAVFADVVE